MERDRAVIILLDSIVETKTGEIYPLTLNDWKLKKEGIEKLKPYLGCKVIAIIGNNTLWKTSQFNHKMTLVCLALEEALRYEGTIHYEFEEDSNSYRFLPRDGMISELCVEHEINYSDCFIIE